MVHDLPFYGHLLRSVIFWGDHDHVNFFVFLDHLSKNLGLFIQGFVFFVVVIRISILIFM